MRAPWSMLPPDPVILQDGADAPVVLCGHTLRILGASQALLDALGRAMEALGDRCPPELSAPLQSQLLRGLQRLAAGERCGPLPTDVQTAGAGPCPAELPPVARSGAEDQLVRALRPPPDDQLLFRRVLEAFPNEVAVLDAAGRYLFCNPAAIRDPAIRRGIVGLTDREYVRWRGLPEDIAQRREALIAQATEQRRPIAWEEQLQTPHGVKIMRRVYAPVFAADGRLDLMIGYAAEITESLEQTERIHLLEQVAHVSTDALVVISALPGPTFQTVVYANPALEALLGRYGVVFRLYAHPRDWALGPRDREVVAQLLRVLADGHCPGETLHLPDARQWLEVMVHLIADPQGRPSHWAIGLKTITARKRDEEAQARRARATAGALNGEAIATTLSTLLSGLQAALSWQVWIVLAGDDSPTLEGGQEPAWGPAGTVLQASGEAPFPAADGFPAGSGPPELVLALDDSERRPMGTLCARRLRAGVSPDEARAVLEADAALVALLLERHRQRRQLEHLAFTDTLTGLTNRRTFHARLETALQQCGRVGEQLVVGLLDLDRFKQVNDGLGHAKGDELLRSLARRLRQLDRPELLSLARMGGDEFAFLLRGEGSLERFVADLRDCFTCPFDLEGSLVEVQASVGWSRCPTSASDATTLLRQADAAMYAAKRALSFSAVYRPAAQLSIQPLTLEQAMRQGLAAGHFHVVYQPQISLRSGQVLGAEALLRWTHPELGPIRPDEFIPVAETVGLIGTLGAWVMEQACRAAVGWPNPELTLSVNVSTLQLAAPDFVAQVHRALSLSGLCASRLKLELTESGLLTHPEQTAQLLLGLRALGVQVSIDDFGTGYSSMVSLKALPVDELKIDRAFVNSLGEQTQAGRECRAIVEATILLAHALDLTVVAEGVETEAQAQWLREAGCDGAQGWLYAPGLEEAELAGWLQATAPSLTRSPEPE